jgi:hypothetical protein
VNERELGAKWLKKYAARFSGAFVCRIGDSPVSRKPFDAFIVMDGRFTGVEFKVHPNDLEPHQRKALIDVKNAGGTALVVYFSKDGKTVEEVTL